MKTRSFLPALLSVLSFGAYRARQPVVHEDKRLDDVFNPDPAHRSRGAKKSSGGRGGRGSWRRRCQPSANMPRGYYEQQITDPRFMTHRQQWAAGMGAKIILGRFFPQWPKDHPLVKADRINPRSVLA